MFFSLQVDRGNLAQAVSDNMLNDLNMNTNGQSPFQAREARIISNFDRLQLWQYRLPIVIPARRAAISACVQENWTGSLDVRLLALPLLSIIILTLCLVVVLCKSASGLSWLLANVL